MKKHVKSLKIYSPQNFVEALTGFGYYFTQDDTVNEIHKLLQENGIETGDIVLRDYPLDALEEIVAGDASVVLVDTTYINEDCETVNEVRWFQIPEGVVI